MTAFFSFISGILFDIRLVDYLRRNRTIQEDHCQDLGYDGLAVLSTPEVWYYAMKLTEHVRVERSKSLYIGMQYQPEAGALLWDDDARPRSDSPFRSNPPSADATFRYTRLTPAADMRIDRGDNRKMALCGNHKNTASESWGRTVQGELVTSDRKVLDQRKLFSYPECALLCGMTLDCRAAEFNFDLLTCTLIGEYTGSGNMANPDVTTYIRTTF
ncbi:hypothetical protein ElyMa_001332200 [Elysia marginata]|uniref:Apple domain-containing protein n=1 Tax=Elysia marginata TaxID=1093978 RepID=A0AAV4ILL9_9GAST|nr:hypothetical protein ElyMa_001332200 [Elysia marginata]